jgi:hypothetical protein
VQGESEIVTYYRRHESAQTADLELCLDCERRVVDRYFERHTDQVGTRLEREARAKLLMVRAKACSALGLGPREQLSLVARAFALHPTRTGEELGHEAVHLGRRAARKLRRTLFTPTA